VLFRSAEIIKVADMKRNPFGTAGLAKLHAWAAQCYRSFWSATVGESVSKDAVFLAMCKII
jgi:hypothetical protein